MKYFFCVLVITFVSQASAQLRCFSCTNCNTHLQMPVVNCVHPVHPTPPAGTTLPTLPPPTGPATTPGPLPPGTLTPNPTDPPVTTAAPIPQPTTPGAQPELTPPTVAAEAEATTAINDSPNVRKRRSADAEPIEPLALHFSCFVIRVPGAVAGQTQVNRGCVANGGNTNQTCWRANSYLGAPQECRICSGNECNTSSGFALKTSMILIFASILIALKLN